MSESTESGSTELSVPTEVQSALADLTPKQAAAVRYYVTRGSPGYGNKTRAKELAGYSDATTPYQVFSHEDVKHAVKTIREHQLAHAGEVVDEIKALAPEAKDELQSQLDTGRQLDLIDPRDIFGDDLDLIEGKDDQSRLREINKWNKNLVGLMRERREAAKLILAYSEGTPEQRIKHSTKDDKDVVEEFLDKLPKEQFEELGRQLFGEDVKVGPDGDFRFADELEDETEKAPEGEEPPEAIPDYEIVEDES